MLVVRSVDQLVGERVVLLGAMKAEYWVGQMEHQMVVAMVAKLVGWTVVH